MFQQYLPSSDAPSRAQLNVPVARVIARTERRGWEREYALLRAFYAKLCEEGPNPVFDEMVAEHPDVLDSPMETELWFAKPPAGWFTFGEHAALEGTFNLEFSEELDSGGFPFWERPAPTPRRKAYRPADILFGE